jgi:hypothetical protein
MSATFVVTYVGTKKVSKNNRPYVKCKTNKGYDIAFFGNEHISLVKNQSTPFSVTCVVKPTPRGAFKATGVTFWVKQNYQIYFWRVRS